MSNGKKSDAASPRHTPGPWFVSTDALRGWEYRITFPSLDPRGNEVTIADVPNGWNLTARDPEVAANAHLISAAPELLEVAERFEAVIEKVRDRTLEEIVKALAASDLLDLLALSRAAIAKATGEGA